MFGLIMDLFRGTSGISKDEKIFLFDKVTDGLNKTRAFIAENRKNNIDKTSNILSTVWQGVAVELKKMNNKNLDPFINTLYQKSVYWSDPNIYDKEQMDEYKMRLKEVETTLNNLIK